MAQTGTRFIPCLKASSGSGQDQNAKVPRLTTHSYAAGLLPKHPFGHFYCIEQQEKGKKTTDTCSNVDGAQKHHAGQKKPDIENACEVLQQAN